MLRLDHNRALSQLAAKSGKPVASIEKLAVWGNHSPTMYPDLFNAKVGGEIAAEKVGDQDWIENEFLPTVGKRGAAIIDARGASSAASAANAAIDHVHDWVNGTDGEWVSMAVVSDGSYGVDEGLVSSFPVTCSNGEWSIVEGVELNDFSKEKIEATVDELRGERDAVKELELV
jgi:malate dehydrogenase